MKQKLIPIMCAVALVGAGLPIFAQDNGPKQKGKIIIQKFNQPSTNSIGQYRFPLTVNSFVKDLGKPDSTFTDDNESCPVGQIHTWCLESHNFTILVLGDVYHPKVDYLANSRLFAVAKCDSARDTDFSGLWGIKLGDLDNIVKTKLLQIVGNKRNSIFSENNKGPPIHVFLNSFSISHHHTVKKDNLYFYFVINKDSKLEVILQSSFDLSAAC